MLTRLLGLDELGIWGAVLSSLSLSFLPIVHPLIGRCVSLSLHSALQICCSKDQKANKYEDCVKYPALFKGFGGDWLMAIRFPPFQLHLKGKVNLECKT